jgi:Lipocalin-like domain
VQDQDAFPGTWKLRRCVTERQDGQLEYPMGGQPVGVLVHESQGRMSGQVMRPDRAKFPQGASRQDFTTIVKEAFEGYIAYFGTYALDAARGIVTHHVDGSLYPNGVGGDQQREYSPEGDRLTLTARFQRPDGWRVTGLEWERI